MKHRILFLAGLCAAFFTVSWAGIMPPITVNATFDEATPDWGVYNFASIQAAINAAAPGSEITIEDGVYVEKLTITKPISLVGASEIGVIVSAMSFSGNAVFCNASNVTISRMTLICNGSSGSGFKMQGTTANSEPGVTQDGVRAENVSVSQVTVASSYLCGIDFNGINGGTISEVTVLGSVTERGISIVDCDNITVANVTASGNHEADLGITASGRYFPGGVNTIVINGPNSFNGVYADVYTELDDPAYSITGLDLSSSGLAYRAIQAGELKVTYHTTLELAVSRALSYHPMGGGATYPAVAEIDADVFYVQDGLKIADAIDAAPENSTINIAAGTYDECVQIDKDLSFGALAGSVLPAPDFAEPPITITSLIINNINGFTLSGPIQVTDRVEFMRGNLYTSQANFLELGPNAYLSSETASGMIVGDVHTRRELNGTDGAPGYNDFGGIGVEIGDLKENLGTTTIIRRTGLNTGIAGKTIDRVWLLYGNVTPTKDGTITLSWFANEDNGITWASLGAHAQAYRSMTGDISGSGWTAIGPTADVAAGGHSITFSSRYGGYYTISGTDIPLPVELNAFTAAASSKKVMLAWSTATEKNNHGFEIERRAASGTAEWEKVGFVQGAGTSNAPQQYAYSDVVTAGKFEYRLKQIDVNGSFHYSQIVDATVAFTAEDYAVTQNYPNPFNPTTTIRFAVKTAQQAVVKVYNTLGQEVRTLFNETAQPETMYSLTFDATGLPSGSYYYVLRTADRTDVRRMLLVK